MGKALEKKKKKKGRPSLLDLQKRSLRLHHHQHPNPNPNPNPNPYARFHNPPAPRLAHRNRNPYPNPNPNPNPINSAEEDEDEPAERRKAKKLKLVVHLPKPDSNSSDSNSQQNMRKSESENSSQKATEAPQDLGPATLLPDKKLLVFILDRLQKKDTYGVFSEPVDPEELPDYHGMIQNPMDFGTVRKRLSSGAYRNLEQFEKDVFLISSNAMRYNAPNTIYFRQARSIHQLAKKSFENLRQESDDNDSEPKIARRGRPPGTVKSSITQQVEFSSEASLANASNGGDLLSNPMNDFLRGESGFHKPGVADASAIAPSPCFPSSDSYVLSSEHKSERSEDYSGTTMVAGSALKGYSKSGKKLSAKDENWRDSHKQCQLSSTPEMPEFKAPARNRKQLLVPVGLHLEFAYARSLTRFAANFGPIGWKFAAKRIEKSLPPGTKFGPGWVGESDSPQQSQRLSSPPSRHPSSAHSNVSTASRDDRHSNDTEQECQFISSPSPTSVAAADSFPDTNKVKGSLQLCEITMFHPAANGFKPPSTANLYEPRKLTKPNAATSNFGLYM